MSNTNRTFYKSVLRLGLPIALSQLLTSSLSTIDMVMVSALGDHAISAVGVSNSFSFLLFMIIWGITSGFGIFIAQFWGSQEINKAQRVFFISIISAFVISFIFFLVSHFFPETIISFFNNGDDPIERAIVSDLGSSYIRIASFSYMTVAIGFSISMYMRSVEKVIYPQIISILSVMLNTGLNFLLIEGRYGAPALGVEGAAIATVISSTVSLVLLASLVLLSKQPIFMLRIREFKQITKEFLAHVFKTSLYVTFNETIWGLGMTMYLIAISYISANAVAAMSIANSIMGLTWFLNSGISTAAAIMLGNAMGRNDLELAKTWGKKFIVLSFIGGLILGGILVLFNGSIIDLFSDASDTVRRSAELIVMIFGFYIPIKFINALHIVGTLRSGGDTKYALFSEIIPLWLVGVPLAFILSITTNLPLYLIVLVINVEELIKFGLLTHRFFSYKWVKNLTLTT